jgi:hypothetical protein
MTALDQSLKLPHICLKIERAFRFGRLFQFWGFTRRNNRRRNRNRRNKAQPGSFAWFSPPFSNR